jgi:O-antigen/teichoic acid export membrane protein
MVERTEANVTNGSIGLSIGDRVVKNSLALFVVAIFTQGAGMIVAILIARHLGPAALGTYAVVMGFAVLFEHITPLGQPFVIIRELARDQSRLFTYWVNSSLVTILSAIALAIVLILVVRLAGYNTAVRSSAFVVALFLPLAGLHAIAQAVFQGLEQMEYLTVSTFVGRVIGLFVLWFLLLSGVEVIAAFISYGIFQFAALLVLFYFLLREAGQITAIKNFSLDLHLCWNTLRISTPFIIQILLMGALLRVSVILLPLYISMETVGMFDAADRVRQASAMVIPLVTIAILPTLSRTFRVDRGKSIALLEKALKLLLIVIFPFVFVVAIAADQIIPLLYGSGYEAAVPVLSIIIWTQVFFVSDAVLNQIMMASNNERPMVRNTALSLGASVVLTIVLAPRYGAVGAAWVVVLTGAINLGLDAMFVTSHIARVNLSETVGKPLICAILTGGIAFALSNQGLFTLLAVSIVSYLVLLLFLGVFSRDELLLVRQLSNNVWKKVISLKR